MLYRTDDLRVREVRELIPADELLTDLPGTERSTEVTFRAREAIHRVLHGDDDRLLVVIGPCSIHDYEAAIEYASRLQETGSRLASDLLLVMRVYFEKPRTTVGWKGLINDPGLDGSFCINDGLRLARRLLLAINEMGVPAGTEFLDPFTPQYIADLVSWGAIGARTTESQVHRELASGLSCPVGFKNGTDGNLQIAVEAVRASRHAHHFLGVTKRGHSAILSTTGNEDTHIILRGGRTPNYDAASVEAVAKELAAAGLAACVMIDFSHANSQKEFKRQLEIGREVAAQIAGGDQRIFGAMIESHLNEGRQDLVSGGELIYGQSITDACLGWRDSVQLLQVLAEAVRRRRAIRRRSSRTQALI
jgi:3-deoxy-7-phosphoheptulonate synthase